MPRHLVAVKTGDGGSAFTGRVDKDRSYRAAVHRRVKNARQHDDSRRGFQAVGQGDQDRHARDGTQTGKDADKLADRHADETEQEIVQRQRRLESMHEQI